MRKTIKKIIALSLTVICISNCILQIEAQSVQTENAMTAEEKIATIQNPIDTDEGKVVSSYLYFGSYPQSEVTGDALTSDIISADYNENGDAVVNGQKYRRVCEEDAYYTLEEYLNDEFAWSISNGRLEELKEEYQQYFFNWSDGKYHYFKYEPIKWQVYSVTNGNAVLVSDDILDHRIYCENGYYELKDRWKTAWIRCWLNGYDAVSENDETDYNKENFVDTAFSKKELRSIIDSVKQGVVYAEDGKSYSYEIATCDKVILPVYEEARLFAKTDRIKQLTDYSSAMGMRQDRIRWWTAALENHCICQNGVSPGRMCSLIAYVRWDGQLWDDWHPSTMTETTKVRAESDEMMIGVVPCITLDLSSTDLWMTEDEYLTYKETGVSVIGYEKGDIDTDGEITLDDAKIALSVALGIQVLSFKQRGLADFDCNDILDLQDANMILKLALGIADYT